MGPFGSVLSTTPLVAASEKGRTEIVKLLLKGGASVDEGGTFGPFNLGTPLSIASDEGHTKVGDLLLKAGATPPSSASKEL